MEAAEAEVEEGWRDEGEEREEEEKPEEAARREETEEAGGDEARRGRRALGGGEEGERRRLPPAPEEPPHSLRSLLPCGGRRKKMNLTSLGRSARKRPGSAQPIRQFKPSLHNLEI